LAALEHQVDFRFLSALPTLLSSFVHFPEPVLNPRAVWAIGHIGDLLAELMLSVPEMLAILGAPVIARRRCLTVTRRRRLPDRHLTDTRDPNLSLGKCCVR
jgi:hypothetical protein